MAIRRSMMKIQEDELRKVARAGREWKLYTVALPNEIDNVRGSLRMDPSINFKTQPIMRDGNIAAYKVFVR